MIKLKTLIAIIILISCESFIIIRNTSQRNLVLNSHSNKIKTAFNNKQLLIQSILDINPYLIVEDSSNTLSNEYGVTPFSDISIRQKNGIDIIFTYKDNCYQMITDLKYWQLSMPPEQFLKLLTQKYSVNGILNDLDQEGFYIN